jgi:hypothetical protein
MESDKRRNRISEVSQAENSREECLEEEAKFGEKAPRVFFD